jgi:pyridoxal 5'-phosphate synthase pdxT subunit
MQKIIGILGMHGSREEHAEKMRSLGYGTIFVRSGKDFERISGLILPGGESTSFGLLLKWSNIQEIFAQKILQDRLPVYGTCAGAILLSKSGSNFSIGAIDIDVERNAYGRQIDSFKTDIFFPIFGNSAFPSIFIRAPKISRAGTGCEILGEYEGNPILVRDTEKKVLVSTFHPELTSDNRIHELFSSMIST